MPVVPLKRVVLKLTLKLLPIPYKLKYCIFGDPGRQLCKARNSVKEVERVSHNPVCSFDVASTTISRAKIDKRLLDIVFIVICWLQTNIRIFASKLKTVQVSSADIFFK